MRKPPSVTVSERPKGSGKFSVRWREQGHSREERSYTKPDAEARAVEVRRRFQQGRAASDVAITVTELSRAWWNSYVDSDRIALATRETYATHSRIIVAELGDRYASSITTGELGEWANDLATRFSNAKVNKTLKTLASIYQRGVESSSVEVNPVRGVRRMPEQRNEVVIPSKRMIEYLEATAPSRREYAMLMVATRCGLRQSELFALDWASVQTASLTISKAADRDRTVRNTTKTMRSRRVPMPGSVYAAISRLPRTSDLLFPSVNGEVISRASWSRFHFTRWKRHAAWMAAGQGDDCWPDLLTVKWAHFRHYAISRWASAGATLLQASRWAGHGTPATTANVYSFLFDHDEIAVMMRLDT